MSQGISIISFNDVAKQFDKDNIVLSAINLDIKKGEFIFLVGKSGSGKTTFLKLLYLAEKPTKGNILLEDIDITRMTPASIPLLRRKIGIVFQDFKLLNKKTIFENVLISLEVIGIEGDKAHERVKKILSAVGLGAKLDKYPQQLSGGEQQRVAIARAVVIRPQIILADEPTGNLDWGRTREIIAIMDELNAWGATIIFATHNERLYENSHRRVITLEDGKILS
jgi:cell division transport system ATP-binding protein